jgi:hypothetical protein
MKKRMMKMIVAGVAVTALTLAIVFAAAPSHAQADENDANIETVDENTSETKEAIDCSSECIEAMECGDKCNSENKEECIKECKIKCDGPVDESIEEHC